MTFFPFASHCSKNNDISINFCQKLIESNCHLTPQDKNKINGIILSIELQNWINITYILKKLKHSRSDDRKFLKTTHNVLFAIIENTGKMTHNTNCNVNIIAFRVKCIVKSHFYSLLQNVNFCSVFSLKIQRR